MSSSTCWQALPVAELSAELLSACLGHPLLEIQRDGRRYWLPAAGP
jgi:iron complex transport system ATP-binding protein